MSMPAIRVLIADDHPLFRKGLRALLTTRPEFEVIGEATTGAEAVDLAAAHHAGRGPVALVDAAGAGLLDVERADVVVPAGAAGLLVLVRRTPAV